MQTFSGSAPPSWRSMASGRYQRAVLDHMLPVQGTGAGRGLDRHLGGAGERRARDLGRGEAPGTALHGLVLKPSRGAAPPRA